MQQKTFHLAIRRILNVTLRGEYGSLVRHIRGTGNENIQRAYADMVVSVMEDISECETMKYITLMHFIRDAQMKSPGIGHAILRGINSWKPDSIRGRIEALTTFLEQGYRPYLSDLQTNPMMEIRREDPALWVRAWVVAGLEKELLNTYPKARPIVEAYAWAWREQAF